MPFGLFSSEEAENPRDLVGTLWRLEHTRSLDRMKAYVPPEDQVYAFRLLDGGAVKAREACNSCGGTYEVISDDSISIGFGCTEKACERGWFHGFSAAMARVRTYEIQEDRLRLSTEGDIPPVYAGEEHEVLVFRATRCRENVTRCK
jgi:heat shock protein HslJ